MTDEGTHLTVEEGESTIAELLRFVRENGRTIRIVSAGSPVAELKPCVAKRQLGPLPGEPRMTLSKDYDPSTGVPEDWWPDAQR